MRLECFFFCTQTGIGPRIVLRRTMDNNTTCDINNQVDKYLFPVVYSIVIVIGIPVNCISLYVSCMQVRKKNELAIYLFSLSLADLFYCLILPLWIDYTSRGDNWQFSSMFCKISAFIIQTNFYTSAVFLTCISADRYLALVYPLRFQHLRSRRCALIVSIFFWTLETIFNFSVLIHNETFTNVCMSRNYTICYDKYPMEPWQANFNIFRIITGHTIPLTIILFCYYKIYRVVRRNKATEDREKRKIKKLLLSITVTFIGCFTPYHAVLLIRSIKDSLHMYVIYRIILALTSLNCITDPILYCFVSESGRTDILNLFKCCFSMQHTELSQPRMVVVSSTISKSIRRGTSEDLCVKLSHL